MRFVVFFLLAAPVFAQDDLVMYFNIGNIGIEGNFPRTGDFNPEMSISFVNFGIESRRTGLEFVFSPFNLFNDAPEANVDASSLLNLKLFWNVIGYRNYFEFLYFGPFSSIHYLFVDNWNSFIFTAGLHAGIRLPLGITNYNVFTAELGFRNINGSNKFHISAKVDILLFIAIIFSSNSENR